MTPDITIEPRLTLEAAETAGLSALLSQLSPGAPYPDNKDWAELLKRDDYTLFVASEGKKPVGMLSLVLYRIPTGTRAWIEDVVVSQSHRGQGIGEALTRAAVEKARHLGAGSVFLTSRPAREAANRLYRRLGFERKETNFYRLRLDGT